MARLSNNNNNNNNNDERQLKSALDALGAIIENLANVSSNHSSQKKKKLQSLIAKGEERLRTLREKIDPISQPPFVFDPADPKNHGELIGDTLLKQELHKLDSISRFYGSGIYAIYYCGNFEAYRAISSKPVPIYVGKAVPASTEALTPQQQGEKLRIRISKHRESISLANNIELNDFEVRFLVVLSGWEEAAETYLINRFKPVWNKETKVCSGFGKHGDSSKTRANKRSLWDTLHPGRPWAWRKGNIDNDKSTEEIVEEIKLHYERYAGLLGLS